MQGILQSLLLNDSRRLAAAALRDIAERGTRLLAAARPTHPSRSDAAMQRWALARLRQAVGYIHGELGWSWGAHHTEPWGPPHCCARRGGGAAECTRRVSRCRDHMRIIFCGDLVPCTGAGRQVGGAAAARDLPRAVALAGAGVAQNSARWHARKRGYGAERQGGGRLAPPPAAGSGGLARCCTRWLALRLVAPGAHEASRSAAPCP